MTTATTTATTTAAKAAAKTTAKAATTAAAKPTAKPTAKSTAKSTTAKSTTENFSTSYERAEKIAKSLRDSTVARVENLRKDGEFVAPVFTQIVKSFSSDSFVRCIEKTEQILNYALFQSIIAKHKTGGSTDNSYLQAKTLVKVIKCIEGFANKNLSNFDTPSRDIIFNAMVNNGKISAKGCFATLARVEFDAMTVDSEILSKRNGYSTGTAQSQKSSSREMLRATGLIENGQKGKHNADLILLPHAQQSIGLYFEPIAKKLGLIK